MDFTLHLANQADIQSLFRMTPYCWKTPKAGVERMEALENLDGKKRDVILRYYFLGFDDTEISKILEVNRSTIQRRRHAGLEFIKKFMEEEA